MAAPSPRPWRLGTYPGDIVAANGALVLFCDPDSLARANAELIVRLENEDGKAPGPSPMTPEQVRIVAMLALEARHYLSTGLGAFHLDLAIERANAMLVAGDAIAKEKP